MVTFGKIYKAQKLIPNMKELTQMNEKEKKKFFSLDLAERMIRVEQNVSASFNRYVPYYQTEYYKSMSEKQREDLKKFIKHKKRRKVISVFSIFLPLILFSFLRIGVTGNVVSDAIGPKNLSILEIALIILFVVLVIIGVYVLITRKNSDERFKKNVKIIDDIIVKKYRTKK